MCEIDQAPTLNKKLKDDIEVVVDRVVVRADIKTRLADSLETALSLADGIVYAENADTGAQTVFSANFAAPVSGVPIYDRAPRLCSSTNPLRAAPPTPDP